jgi:hypothetical protein
MSIYIAGVAGNALRFSPDRINVFPDTSRQGEFFDDFSREKSVYIVKGEGNSDMCFFQPCYCYPEIQLVATGDDAKTKITPDLVRSLLEGYYTFYEIEIIPVGWIGTARQFLGYQY